MASWGLIAIARVAAYPLRAKLRRSLQSNYSPLLIVVHVVLYSHNIILKTTELPQ